MKKQAARSAEFYRDGVKMLREYAYGFKASDGYNLREPLSSAQKRQIALGVKEIDAATAQQRYIYKPKNRTKAEKVKLAAVQKIVQTDAPTKLKLKVAFVPYVQRVLKSGKLSKPRITVTKSGGVRIQDNKLTKIFIPVDQKKVVRSAEKTIRQAVADIAPDATRFSIQAGQNEMPMFADLKQTILKFKQLQKAYNGKTPLPENSGNAGDKASLHDWRKWLHGINGYAFNPANVKQVYSALNAFRDGNKKLRLKRAADKKKAARARLKEKAKGQKRR